MPLTRERLDHMAATIYETGLPRPDPKAESIILKSNCHPDAPAVAWLDPSGFGLILTVVCAECYRFVAAVALVAIPKKPLSCRECSEDEVWASYRHASGKLQLVCAGCGREVATLAVMANTN